MEENPSMPEVPEQADVLSLLKAILAEQRTTNKILQELEDHVGIAVDQKVFGLDTGTQS
jgi:hypothetical protein